MSDGAPSEGEIRAALQRLLAWPDMARSGQLARFLSYIVERRLNGDAQAIKAYSIAVDVFGRSTDFDPQTDPIVRVQARRLRALLSQYYREAGAGEEVRITLPTGRYVPDFLRADGAGAAATAPAPVAAPVMPPKRAGLGRSWILLAALTVLATLVALSSSIWWTGQGEQRIGSQPNALVERPRLLITEFQSLTGDFGDLGMVASLAVEMVGDLGQFGTIAVDYGGAAQADMADYVLSGIVRREAGGLQFSAILTEVWSGGVVWNRTIGLSGSEIARTDLVSHVSDRLSMMLGGARGPLHRNARTLVANNSDLTGRENLYLCRILFDLYRERSTDERASRTQRCFSVSGIGMEQSGEAQAALAMLGAEMAESTAIRDEQDAALAQATQRMEHAAALAPVSGFVWEQRARLLELTGRHDLAEAAYSTASQINPANSDAIAARARHLAFLGRLDAAITLMAPVMADSPDPPSWYYAVPTLQALRDQSFAVAARRAGTYTDADRELGPILAVMAGQRLDNVDIVNRYLPRVLDLPSFRTEGVLTRLRGRIVDEGLLRDIRVALLSAGVPPGALNGPF
ncbi:tetratricopeptide repeat protein [Devosia chinhatensis]|uniref:Uncharacterized protein n=1 Tax=Devosia chinhatensis TaxID=429727 RepID=A0A0F5FEN3_9HYPH|nr:tetratricopeptide repeat protein [Devosia chinhatensis]KKB07258.1 hypothetical protein VE26_10655 [Devosia chinhatensis]